MSEFTDAFAAAVANLKSLVGTGGLTGDQVDQHIHAVTDPLVQQITTIANSESDDATKVADILTALNGLSTTFAPSPAPAPAPAPAPSPAPASTPSVSFRTARNSIGETHEFLLGDWVAL